VSVVRVRDALRGLGKTQRTPLFLSLSISVAVAHIPGANIKEFLVTILREAKRLQSQLFEPGGRVLGLQWSER